MSSQKGPPLTLIVGMHRSGTSLLGSLLQALGAHLPGRLIAGDVHNPQGYFEWDELVHLQERLLIDLQRWWPSAEGAQAMPAGWLAQPVAMAAQERLVAMLRPVLEQAPPSTVVIKDPRTSRLLPLWLAVAAELGLSLRLLLAIRDPAEVIRSLLHRDAAITGMTAARAQAIWWRFNLEPIHAAAAGSLPINVVDYSRWFDHPQSQLDALLAALPDLQPTPQQCLQALELIRPEYRRSLRQPGENLALNRRVTGLYRQLRCTVQEPWPSPEPPRRLMAQAIQPRPPAPQQLLAKPAAWTGWLETWRHHPAPQRCGAITLATESELWVNGGDVRSLQVHLWLQRLPITNLAAAAVVAVDQAHQWLRLGVPSPSAPGQGLARIVINLQEPHPQQAELWLAPLRTAQAIWDPDPARVCLMRALGLPAHWLDPSSAPNGWLERPDASDPARWGGLLGLAPPTEGAVIVLGDGGEEWNRSLAREEAGGSSRSGCGASTPPLVMDYRPGWFSLIRGSCEQAQAQAGWLVAAAARGSALILMQSAEDDAPSALLALCHGAASVRVVQPPITPARLRASLVQRPAVARAEDRPSPPVDTLFEWAGDGRAQIAVVVSLFNYAERVLPALNSVVAQRQIQLELIVVDDASADDGPQLVREWMQDQINHGVHPFVGLRLLRHGHNVGLAGARNTGFRHAEAPWCFVLDADNQLYPDAVKACLELAEQGSERLAVVHPLIAVEAEAGVYDDKRSLVAPISWQSEILAKGNGVDAMALVRRSAWEAVAGYTHIEGGWEDYDFWCKLIESGFYGIQCPRILAVYRSHPDSMSASDTNSSWPPLSRALSLRHPWLTLPINP